MNFSEEAEVQIHTLKQQLVPNFNLLDHHVQTEIVNILQTLISNPEKKIIQEFSRLGLLQEAPLLRSHIWKLLLETISIDPKTWNITKKTNFDLYRTLNDKFIGRYVDEDDLLTIKDKFDQNLWSQIQLDTRRTHSAFNFYQKQIDHTKIYLKKPTKNSDVLSRILYIWGRMNSTVRYVQGMNEILAPIYYLQFQKYTPYAESQVFFMFSSLMTFLIDMHIKDMDESEQGIMGRMRILNKYLKVVDYQLWSKLDNQKILPQYYSFRWLALLLAQQFGLYQTMKLWDVMLSYDGYKRYFYLYCCCISILKYRKQIIIKQDFVSILPSIQKLRDVNVGKIIEIANKLYEKYSKINIEKLFLRMNDQLQKQKEEERRRITQIQEQKKRWNYSNMLSMTGNLFNKIVGNFKK